MLQQYRQSKKVMGPGATLEKVWVIRPSKNATWLCDDQQEVPLESLGVWWRRDKIWALGNQNVGTSYDGAEIHSSEGTGDQGRNSCGWTEKWQSICWDNPTDDKSLSLMMDMPNNGRKDLIILREYYAGKGKPRVINVYKSLSWL